jgi:hypothetical protein
MTVPYDSRADTLDHIRRVNHLMLQSTHKLLTRAAKHDQSKLEEPEKTGFDTVSVKLKNIKYGSPEYAVALEELKPFLEHHYANNDHHPEHGTHGIDSMNLLSLIEMLNDWKAATERMDQGNVRKSLQINRDRFKISPQLYSILENTITEMGW